MIFISSEQHIDLSLVRKLWEWYVLQMIPIALYPNPVNCFHPTTNFLKRLYYNLSVRLPLTLSNLMVNAMEGKLTR